MGLNTETVAIAEIYSALELTKELIDKFGLSNLASEPNGDFSTQVAAESAGQMFKTILATIRSR